jgi:hypothetical protein
LSDHFYSEIIDIRASIHLNNSIDQSFIAKNISDLKTVVIVRYYKQVVGNYRPSGKAIKNYIEIEFIDYKSKKVVKKITLWGGDPPTNVVTRRGNDEIDGSTPSTEEIIETITSSVYK